MAHVEGKLEAPGHPALHWQAWLPAGRVKAVIVLAHGASEHGGRYAHVGERFAASGYALYAMDHRGHGRSPGQPGNIERMDAVVGDLQAFLTGTAAARHPGTKVFLFGHSFGGMVAVAYALRHQDELSGLILTGVLAALETGSAAQRTAGRVLSRLTPGLAIIGIDAATVSRDPEVVAAYVADPLNYHGKVRARTVGEMVATAAGFPAAVGALTLPLLVMHGTEDKLVPPAGSQLVYDGASSPDKTLRWWDGLHHELVNEPEREQVMDEIVAWLDARA
jgi:alpha-beta hydrolase superfamily lysophospholipase